MTSCHAAARDAGHASGHAHLKDLVKILHEIKPPTIVGKRVNDAHEVVELVSLPSKRVDEVYPGILLGDYTVAESKPSLKNLSVTHVLNCAQGHGNHSVPTDEHFYKGTGMKFMGIPAVDHPGFDLSQYFDEAASFINNCLAIGGRIFVHCVQGISRSSTIVCAYLMLRKSYSASQALTCVRKKRNVCPNEGFLQQLVDLNNRLAMKREHKILSTNSIVSRGMGFSSSFSTSPRKTPYLSYLDNGATPSSNGVTTSMRNLPPPRGPPGVPTTTLTSTFSPKYHSLLSMLPTKTYTAGSPAPVNGGGANYNYRRYAI